MFCTNCGAPQPELVPPFCGVCGGPWGWLCPCGNANSPEGKFCAACGVGRPVAQSPKSAEAPDEALRYSMGSFAPQSGPEKPTSAPVIEQLSPEEIDQLLAESRTLAIAQKQTITQADIDKLFEKK